MPPFDWSILWPMLPLLLCLGVVAGVLAGLLGIGGGLVLIPFLHYLFLSQGVDLEMAHKMSLGTSLATIIVTTASSTRAHHRRGAVEWGTWRTLAPFIVAGSLVGTVVADVLRGAWLIGLFAVMLTFFAARMILSAKGTGTTEHKPVPLSLPVHGSLAAVMGTLASLMGIGAGSMGVPALMQLGFIAQRAVATSAAMGMVIAVPGVIGYAVGGIGEAGRPPLSLGYVNLLAVACIIPATLLAAPLGAKLAHALPARKVKQAFGVFLVIVALNMIRKLFEL